MDFSRFIPTQSSDYESRSKGVGDVKPNLTLAKLFGGIGDITKEGLKGATDTLDINIENAAQSGADKINDIKDLSLEDAATLGKFKNKAERGGLSTLGGPSEALGSPQASSEGGGATLLPGDTQNSPATPVEVKDGLSEINKRFQQYQEGKGSRTYWLMQQQVLAQQLKQRFPNSEKEVDAALHRATAPANEIRAQIFSDFQAASTAANTQIKWWDAQVDKMSPYLGEAGVKEARNPAVYGDRTKQTEIIARVAGQESAAKKIAERHASLSLDIIQGQVDQQKAERSLTLDLHGKVSSMMTGILSPLTGVQKQIEEAENTREFTPDFITTTNTALGQMERAASAEFDRHINAPTMANGQSYASTIRDPAVIAKAKAAALEGITRLKNAVNDNDVGLASYFAKNMERTKDYSANDLLKNNEVLRRLAGFEKAVGGQGNITGKLLLDNKVLTDVWEAAAARNTANKVTGKGSPAEAVQPQEGQNPPPQVPKLEMKHIETLITDPQSTPEMRKNAITYLTNDKDGEFFKALDKPSQLQAFNTLTQSHIAQAAYENGPESWGKYKDWAQNTYLRLTASRAGDLQTVAKNDQLKYNPETNQLEFTTPPNIGGANYPELQSVLQMNGGLRNLSEVYRLDKTDMTAKVYPMFKNMGVPLMKVEGASSKATPYTPEKQTPEALQAIDNALRTNLEPGKADSHVTGMSPELKTGLAAMLKDAPEGVEIFSGHRSEERQKELFDAAVKKYGSVEKARRWVAPPGHSMHQTGNAADLRFASAEARDWMHTNAKKYGLHFPLGNEPWHIEPVGARK